jgi:hypothetical protein
LLSERLEAGTYQFDIAKLSLKPGSYMLTARFEGEQHIKQIRIPNN